MAGYRQGYQLNCKKFNLHFEYEVKHIRKAGKVDEVDCKPTLEVTDKIRNTKLIAMEINFTVKHNT